MSERSNNGVKIFIALITVAGMIAAAFIGGRHTVNIDIGQQLEAEFSRGFAEGVASVGVPDVSAQAAQSPTTTQASRGPVSLNEAAPMHDGNRSEIRDFVEMGGTRYRNVVRYDFSPVGGFSLHNLNGQFRSLTGYVGRIDGAGMIDATLDIYGDGTLLATYEISAQDLPIPFSVSVEGIRLLRIEFRAEAQGWTRYALAGYLE